MPKFTNNIFAPNIYKHTQSSSAPNINNDSSQGYSAGSQWLKTDTNTLYECKDATVGNAIWVVISGQSIDINSLTEKTTPVDNDVLLIEDSQDSFSKKKIKKSSIGGGVITPVTRSQRLSTSSLTAPTVVYQTDSDKGYYGWTFNSGSSGSGRWVLLGTQGVNENIPITVSANQASGVVTLNWTQIPDTYVAYNVYRDNAFITQTTGSSYSFTEIGGSHIYAVQGIRLLNSSPISITLPSLLTPTKVRLVNNLINMTTTAQLDGATDSNLYYNNYSQCGYNLTEAQRIDRLTNNNPPSSGLSLAATQGYAAMGFFIDLGQTYQIVKIAFYTMYSGAVGGWNHSYNIGTYIRYWNGSGWSNITNATPSLNPMNPTQDGEIIFTFSSPINARYFSINGGNYSFHASTARCRFYAYI